MDEKKFLVLTRSKHSEFKNTTGNVVTVTPSDDKTLVTFLGGKTFPYNRENVRFFDNPAVINIEDSIILLANGRSKKFDEAFVFGNKYIVLFSEGNSEFHPVADVTITPNIAKHKETRHLIDYYRYIATFLKEETPHVQYYYENKLNQIRGDSVLNNFVNSTPSRNPSPSSIIFPFGMNPSQREAVINALTSQISIIQGPPGTGKTQTILNIIANLICQNKTVAVVAGNNEATHNIYEKLEKEGFDFIAASLGKADLQKIFFAKEHAIPEIAHWAIAETDLHQIRQVMTSSDNLVSRLLELQNEQARIKELISRLEVESQYFDRHFSVDPINPSTWSFGNKWSTPNLIKFMAEVEYFSENDKPSWSLKFKWLFKYRIYKFKDISYLSSDLFKGLVSEYYQRRKTELLANKLSIEQELKKHDFKGLLRQYTDSSMTILKHYIFSTHHKIENIPFNNQSYKKSFDNFVKRFPVVLSTTDSIINNKSDDELFDYLIVDEASQVNLLTGVLAMACAKNMVVVGDLKQIPHIPSQSLISTHPDINEKFDIKTKYNYLTESLLSSINKVFAESVPSTLLKEHYRCHPRIIDFCNQKYYDNQLVIMTHSNTEPFKIVKTAPGHHTCQAPGGKSQINFRELEVIKEELLDTILANTAPEKIGIVTPYRAQVLNANHLIDKKDLKIDTAHKFQGREKDIIIYSPTASWADKFNDSPNLINVAVSRAKAQFIMVMSANLFKQQGTNIGDLIRHIEYQSMSPVIFESKTISIFDCLYSEYSPALQDFKMRTGNTSKYLSENLMITLLNDIFADNIFTSFTYKHNYPLSLLISNFESLTEREKKFGQHLSSHIDFLIFNKLDKLPVLAIEVDGYQTHALNPQQRERDELKNSILFKLGIPLLRFPTKRSGEERIIRQALQDIIALIPESDTEQHESVR